MTKITKFGRLEHRLLSQAIVDALKDVGDKFGVDLSCSGGTIGDSDGIVKLAVKIRDVGNGKSGAQAKWDRFAPMYGLQKEWFGETVILRGVAYEIVGFEPSRPKYAVQIKRIYDGKIFGTTTSSVQSQLAKKAAA